MNLIKRLFWPKTPQKFVECAEVLVPRSGFTISYIGTRASDLLMIKNEKGESPLYLYIQKSDDSWSMTLTPNQWSTPPGLPRWAIDKNYFFRKSVVRDLARSLQMIDEEFSRKDPQRHEIEKMISAWKERT